MRFFMVWLLILSAGCGQRQQKISSFSKEKWIADSLGCLNLRWREASILDSSRHLLVGVSFTYLTDVLGKPNVIDSNYEGGITCKYYIEPGVQCEGSQYHVNSDVAVLYVVFGKNGKANKIGVAVP